MVTRVFVLDEIYPMWRHSLVQHWEDWTRVRQNYCIEGVFDFDELPLADLCLDDIVLMEEYDVQWFIDRIRREAKER